MPSCAELAGGAIALAVWWAVWSLADAYLLRYTPWPELALLACALAGYALAICCNRRRQRYARRAPERVDSTDNADGHELNSTRIGTDDALIE